MSEYKKYFEAYCREHDLELRLSFEMDTKPQTEHLMFQAELFL